MRKQSGNLVIVSSGASPSSVWAVVRASLFGRPASLSVIASSHRGSITHFQAEVYEADPSLPDIVHTTPGTNFQEFVDWYMLHSAEDSYGAILAANEFISEVETLIEENFLKMRGDHR